MSNIETPLKQNKLIRITTVPMYLDKLIEGQLAFMQTHYEVIAISSGGISELTIETNSFLIKPQTNPKRDNESFRDYIINNNEDFIVEKNRNYAVKFFGIEKHKKSIEDLYTNLMTSFK